MTRCFSIVCLATLKLVRRAFSSCLDSGHGGQTKDQDGDEDDGYDEGFSLPPHADLFVHRKRLCQLSTLWISSKQGTSLTM
jgi:hypothetical protein